MRQEDCSTQWDQQQKRLSGLWNSTYVIKRFLFLFSKSKKHDFTFFELIVAHVFSIAEAGCSSPFLRPQIRRWINHWSLWRMASETPDLRLPSQPQGITAPWPVPNYTAWWQRHMRVNNLPKIVTWKCKAGSGTRDLWGGESSARNHYVTRPHTNKWPRQSGRTDSHGPKRHRIRWKRT